MSPSDVQALPISTLKAVLFRNHVNASMVVEKGELVGKVQALIDDERAEREAHARREEEEEREMREAMEQSRMEHEERERQKEHDQARAAEQETPASEDTPAPAASAAAPASETEPSPSSSPPPAEVPRGNMTAKAQTMASHLERTGLCVICQDEEANIAIVDCGYVDLIR